jgi:hypothetical protein
MSGFGVDIKIRSLFFDREKIIKAMDRASRRALSRAGAFIRTAARSSIKTRAYGTTSTPGQPPFDHTGFALQRENRRRKRLGQAKLVRKKTAFNQGIRAILFGYDDENKSVVIGPLKFGNKGDSTVPSLLEFGGETTNHRGRQITIKPRPFMAPALKKELPNLPAKWRASVSS